MGTRDGGHHVFPASPALVPKMENVATVLNLAPHKVVNFHSGDGVTLYLGGDVEGHLGTDGQHYLLDLARTFPPEVPPPGLPSFFLPCSRHLHM